MPPPGCGAFRLEPVARLYLALPLAVRPAPLLAGLFSPFLTDSDTFLRFLLVATADIPLDWRFFAVRLEQLVVSVSALAVFHGVVLIYFALTRPGPVFRLAAAFAPLDLH